MKHKTIWLQPWCRMCGRSSDTGRMWREDEFDNCDVCGKKPTRYVIDEQEASQ